MTSHPGKKRILFVCLGNICRSPTGEGVLRSRICERGLSDLIEVDSAGTIDFHVGRPADSRMRTAAGARGYELHESARQVRPGDFDDFDVLVAMDRANYDDLIALRPDRRQKVRMLGSYDARLSPQGGARVLGPDVPDPYYGGQAGFEQVLDMIESVSDAIIEETLSMAGAPE